jgi:hypothetical protein
MAGACARAPTGAAVHTPDDLLRWMLAHRSGVGLASFQIGAEDSGTFLNADRPFPLASTRKVLVLGAYAMKVAEGVLDPNQRIALSAVERWYWPGTDGGAHLNALADWRRTHALDAAQTVRLDDIAHAMILWSDNAAADYVLGRIGGPPAAASFARRLGMREQDPVMPVFGEFVAWSSMSVGAWSQLGPPGRAARAAQLARSTPTSKLSSLPRPSPGVQSKFAALSVAGTPREWAELMSSLFQARGIPSAARDVLRRHLEWLSQNPAISSDFDRVGFKGGSLAGVLTEAWYAKPRGRPAAVVALFLHALTDADSQAFQTSTAFGAFALRVMSDSKFAKRVRSALSS